MWAESDNFDVNEHGKTAVIFDPESLLLDPRPGIEYAMRCAMRDLGVDVPAQWFIQNWSMRTPFGQTLAELIGSSDSALLEAGKERYFSHFNNDGRFRCHLRPGSTQLLASLAADSAVELHYLTHIGAEAAARLLETYGLQHFPRSIVTAEQPACPGLRLPLIKHLVEGSEEPRSAWTLLSDQPWELMAAKRLQFRAIGIGYGRLPTESLVALKIDEVVTNPTQVATLLRRRPKICRIDVPLAWSSQRMH